MGCNISLPREDYKNKRRAVEVKKEDKKNNDNIACDDIRFSGLNANKELCEKGIVCMEYMDKKVLPYLTHKNLLSGFQRTGTWCIYIHIAISGFQNCMAMTVLHQKN